MKTYQIEPMAPLVFRSGRPFGESSRDGANFPWPSSVAGMMRTVAMDAKGWPASGLTESRQKELMGMEAVGPLLARREAGKIMPMFPKPTDALYLLPEKETKPVVCRLAPGEYPAGCGSDLPPGLAPVMLEENAPKSKPQKGADYWTLDQLLAWRRNEEVKFCSLSVAKPEVDTRTNVAIDPNTFAAANGKLFQIEGLDFGNLRRKQGGFENTDWLLLAQFSVALPEQAVTLGGERRLSWLAPAATDPLVMPDGYASQLANSSGIALTLATPALFNQGWKPDWLNEQLQGDFPGIPGLRLRLKAVAIERWQGISGWDLKKWQPKLARKAVAAGATYWFEIISTPPLGWEQKLWLASISDAEQDRRDGFGMVIAGLWTPTSNQ